MKDLIELLEASILGDIDDIIKIGDDSCNTLQETS